MMEKNHKIDATRGAGNLRKYAKVIKGEPKVTKKVTKRTPKGHQGSQKPPKIRKSHQRGAQCHQKGTKRLPKGHEKVTKR